MVRRQAGNHLGRKRLIRNYLSTGLGMSIEIWVTAIAALLIGAFLIYLLSGGDR